jgi:hypothetical protein
MPAAGFDKMSASPWPRAAQTLCWLSAQEPVLRAHGPRLDFNLGHGIEAVKVNGDRFYGHARARCRREPPGSDGPQNCNRDCELNPKLCCKWRRDGFALGFELRNELVVIASCEGRGLHSLSPPNLSVITRRAPNPRACLSAAFSVFHSRLSRGGRDFAAVGLPLCDPDHGRSTPRLRRSHWSPGMIHVGLSHFASPGRVP